MSRTNSRSDLFLRRSYVCITVLHKDTGREPCMLTYLLMLELKHLTHTVKRAWKDEACLPKYAWCPTVLIADPVGSDR